MPPSKAKETLPYALLQPQILQQTKVLCFYCGLLYNANNNQKSKAYVYGRAPAEIVVSNPTWGMDVCLL